MSGIIKKDWKEKDHTTTTSKRWWKPCRTTASGGALIRESEELMKDHIRYHAELVPTTSKGRHYIDGTDADCGDWGTAEEAFEAGDIIIANPGGNPHEGVDVWVFAWDADKYPDAWEAYDANDYKDVARI